MKESQYTSQYLNGNKARGVGRGYTIGTFLAYTLRGAAKAWAGRYARSLERSVVARGARQGRSFRGGVAFYPTE